MLEISGYEHPGYTVAPVAMHKGGLKKSCPGKVKGCGAYSRSGQGGKKGRRKFMLSQEPADDSNGSVENGQFTSLDK